MFGLFVGETVQIKLEREDLDGAAQLFATASAAATPQFEVTQPAAGTAIGANGIIRLRAIADVSGSDQKLEIRYNSATGPIIAEAEPHVFSPLTLNVTVHICTIHSAAAAPGTGVVPSISGTALNAAGVRRLFTMVAAVWRPAGVRIRINSIRSDTYRGLSRNGFAGRGAEENQIVGGNRVANTCNIYLIRHMDNSLGVGVNRSTMAAEGFTNPGIIVGIEGSRGPAPGRALSRRSGSAANLRQELANDLAHEIGHFLDLQHAGRVNSPGLNDTYARRQLMHPNNLLPTAGGTGPRFNNIGYGTGGGGAGHRGCLLTFKRYSTHPRDGDVARARRRFRSPGLY